MTFEITIKPSDHQFECEADETILAGALRGGLLLPYGCRDGACASCKSRILSGEVDYGVYQAATLTDAEKLHGFVLPCVAKPRSDLALECREVRRAGDIQIRKMPARIERIELPAPDVAIVSLKLPANERLQFLAGQYIDILQPEGKRRSFSLATAPHDDGFLQLHVRHMPKGAFTEHLFADKPIKEIIRIEGPHGAFYLREQSGRPMIFVAGGTGFAPIKSVLEHAFHQGVTRPMTLYWGARAKADLYLPDLPRQWAAEHPNFTYVPVLSEPLPSDGWTGRTGLVHQAVLDDHADLSGHQVYACGAPLMVEAARRDFTAQRGLPPEEFFADSFVSAIQPKPA
jgi:CDP-4-dehydro-6-deoxyglucose reductase